MENNLSFSVALTRLKNGRMLRRVGWNASGQWIALQTPDEKSKMCKPYIYISPVDGELVPWLASQTDLLSNDWEVIAEQTTGN